MTETSGSNNPRAQHASQPVGQTNNPRHSQPVGQTNNPRHSQPLSQSHNPRLSQPVAPKQQALGGATLGATPGLPVGDNPYSRGAAGDDYARDRRRKKRNRILVAVLAIVLVGVLGVGGVAFLFG